MLNKLHGREAVPASPLWNVVKTLAQTIVFWGFFLFLLPCAIWWAESRFGLTEWRFTSGLGCAAGTVLFALGGTLGLTSGMIMAIVGGGTPLPSDCAPRLVIVGPYRYVRNPMALAGLSQGVAIGLYLGSPLVVLYALAGGPMWNVLVRPWEEADLEQRFGEPYRRYLLAVKCWLPRRTPYASE